MKNVLSIKLANIIGIGFLCTMLLGCATKKHLKTEDISGEIHYLKSAEKDQFFKELNREQLLFKTINARAKGFLTVNNKDTYDINLQLRMEYKESIWISVTTFLGMEAARVLITPDTIQVINRLESVYVKEPYEAIARFLGEPLSFVDLQSLLLGNTPMNLLSQKRTVNVGEIVQMILLEIPGLYMDSEIRLNEQQRIQSYIIREKDNSQNNTSVQQGLAINHEYQKDNVFPKFPYKSSFLLDALKSKLAATLEYSRLELDAAVSVPFSIPKGYKQIH